MKLAFYRGKKTNKLTRCHEIGDDTPEELIQERVDIYNEGHNLSEFVEVKDLSEYENFLYKLSIEDTSRLKDLLKSIQEKVNQFKMYLGMDEE